MTTTTRTPIQRCTTSRLSQVDPNNLEFGKYISDHMAIAEFAHGEWGNLMIVPFGDIQCSPAMLALHYGQSVFEGMKAFRRKDGDISIFRVEKHWNRLNKSLNRMCMPAIPHELFQQALEDLIHLDEKWVPSQPNHSLYIRPLVFASESRLGVKVSDRYTFIIMTSPVGPYLSKPFRLKVEDYFVRTTEGGPGFAKCAGNYGGAFYPTQIARQEGFDQILWTDAKEHLYIDEVGMMNVMFVQEGKLITPQLSTAILDGVTRDSIIAIAKSQGITVEERKIAMPEVAAGIKAGTLKEAFGAGTAAVVAPISIIHYKGEDLVVPPPSEDSLQLKIKSLLERMRTGELQDQFQWNSIVKV